MELNDIMIHMKIYNFYVELYLLPEFICNRLPWRIKAGSLIACAMVHRLYATGKSSPVWSNDFLRLVDLQWQKSHGL